MSLSFYPFIVLCCPGSHVKKKEVLSFTKKKTCSSEQCWGKNLSFLSAYTHECNYGRELYLFSGLSFVSNEVPGVYNSIVLLLQKPTLWHTNTHTQSYTERERERKERKEVSCQVFKISFRKNKASQIRARSLLLAVRRGEKAGQQSTKASIFLKLLFRESIYSPIFSSSYPNLRLIPFLLSLLCLTRPSSPVTQSCVFPLNI